MLTDLEICKSIAEIEFTNPSWVIKYTKGKVKIINSNDCEIYDNYNPLMDDALCFNLMDKYNVNISSHPQTPEYKYVHMQRIEFNKVCHGRCFSINELGLNKAICLAIMEAHK